MSICIVRNHGSPQWYDIVHFEHKLMPLPSYQWKCIPYMYKEWSPLIGSYHPQYSIIIKNLISHAPPLQGGVITERCYGCGRCSPVCPYDKISMSLVVDLMGRM